MKKTQRKVVVMTSLVVVLTLTSALLLVLAPPPLNAGESYYNSLNATDQDGFLGGVFKTAVQTEPDRWKYIYIHQSSTDEGNAQTLSQSSQGLGDHFVIGNGDGCEDGEIQLCQRWNNQKAANPPSGARKIDPACISICLIGDFDDNRPTANQMRRLTQLVTTLQSQLRISGDQVVLMNPPQVQPGVPASIGRLFPVSAFKEQILP